VSTLQASLVRRYFSNICKDKTSLAWLEAGLIEQDKMLFTEQYVKLNLEIFILEQHEIMHVLKQWPLYLGDLKVEWW
jgi:hypothetical protein